MTDPLHIRLRDFCREDSSRREFPIGDATLEMENSWAEALADEVEDEYLLLPIDPDGKPWHVGDQTQLGAISQLSFTEYGWVVYLKSSMVQNPVSCDLLKRLED